MNKGKGILIILSVIISQACTTGIDQEKYATYQSKGNEISNQAQAILLANVGQAIQAGGPEYAVEFCNLNASEIIDSLNAVSGSSISRVSARNRNLKNALLSENEREIWQIFENNTQADTVVQLDKNLVYYKRINIVLPACLKCHGTPGSDINEPTQEKLHTLYPGDLATGYHLNDFRGLWKITFPMEK